MDELTQVYRHLFVWQILLIHPRNYILSKTAPALLIFAISNKSHNSVRLKNSFHLGETTPTMTNN